MKGQNHTSTSSCNIHPVEFIEGVCPLCLNEKLLVLASLQRRQPPSSSPSYHNIQESSKKKNIRLFSFLGFFELRHHKSYHQTTSTISPEDSFISIKFEDNVATSWEKEKENFQLENCKGSWDHQYHQHVMHHTKKKKEISCQPTPRPLLTWRKRISRLVHVIGFRKRLAPRLKVMIIA
ncbi:hypothetical protein EUTSA_v10011817mg [Eutrema salsugineum]|uniref:Uncharacterized protein n=1 Tax=Eutrema salsugineum TaxID=72664 RepID=V4KM82_EUTSA|nr:uncharacterized protein LOC18010942 [Eutrema salsugineum]ESQ31007.1 hypothetical protein EUTSA_v10011817mg [Eutrema salsugineum]